MKESRENTEALYEEEMTEHPETIELIDEEGNPTIFDIVATLVVEEREYAVLAEEGNEEEVAIFRITEMEDGEYMFDAVVDEEELNDVAAAYMELLEESEEDCCGSEGCSHE